MWVLAQAGGSDALALAVVLAIIYMVIVRFMDLNEKEPLWAMGLVFGIGFFAAMLLYLIVGTRTLELQLVGGAVIRELVKIVAVGLAIGALDAIGRGRGWSEVDGPLDGVVYGTAVGLGFATGGVFVVELLRSAAGTGIDLTGSAPIASLWPIALRGLSEGLFGGVIGAGFGLAASMRDRGRRPALIGGAAIAAIALHILYNLMARGAGATSAGRILGLLALLLPLVLVALVVVWSLRTEKRIIATELPPERDSGLVTEEEMQLLTSFGARRSAYMKRLTSGDLDGWGDLKALHNRQVQLAFAKDRAAKDPSAHGEVERLRGSIAAMRGTSATPAAASAEGTGA
jgi:hypothetical protein